MTKKRRSATQRWNRAVAEAHADAPPLEPGATDAEAKQALAAVLAMSDEEVERELRRAGVDLDAFGAESGREFDALMAKTGGATSEPEAAAADDEGGAWVAKVEAPVSGRRGSARGRGRKGYAIAYAAAAAAATVGVTTYLATRPPKETPDERPDASAKDAAVPPEPVPSAKPAPVVPDKPVNEPDPKGPKGDKAVR